MNQQQAESVKDLAKPTVEALGVITERECPKCNDGKVPLPSVGAERKCHKCNGIGKVKWKWEPKVGDWWFDERKDHGRSPILISLPSDIEWIKTYPTICIPILYWEEIERVLKKVEYSLELQSSILIPTRWPERKWRAVFWRTLGQQDTITDLPFDAKSRQEAVMKSVTKLKEELNAKA